ncbi:MAG: hypothetical protein LBH84_01160 [Prevotellaceae bacterium]|jgi:hypothetical protein|nr:hypothetical protein [Prevotellaceae bacterium]
MVWEKSAKSNASAITKITQIEEIIPQATNARKLGEKAGFGCCRIIHLYSYGNGLRITQSKIGGVINYQVKLFPYIPVLYIVLFNVHSNHIIMKLFIF